MFMTVLPMLCRWAWLPEVLSKDRAELGHWLVCCCLGGSPKCCFDIRACHYLADRETLMQIRDLGVFSGTLTVLLGAELDSVAAVGLLGGEKNQIAAL